MDMSMVSVINHWLHKLQVKTVDLDIKTVDLDEKIVFLQRQIISLEHNLSHLMSRQTPEGLYDD